MIYPSLRITRWVTFLARNEIFVFGSNEAGNHKKGAAEFALSLGARWGVAEGLSGQTYAIPTKPRNVHTRLLVSEIKRYVNRFIDFARRNPQLIFLVTDIGCGLAKYDSKDIAPLFRECVDMKNVHLPECFWKVLLSDS